MKYISRLLLFVLFTLRIYYTHSQVCDNGVNNWVPDKSAIRIGHFDPVYLNIDSIGCYSAAFGFNNFSSRYAFATGFQSIANGDYSVALGHKAVTAKTSSLAFGFETTASGSYSVAIGRNTQSKSYGGIVLGQWNDNTDTPGPSMDLNDRLFQLGNGTGIIGDRANAITVLRNGKTGLNVTAPQKNLSIKGGLNIDQGNQHIAGQLGDNMLTFGSSSGEGIGSDRSNAATHWGLVFYTNSLQRMTITNDGFVNIGATGSTTPNRVLVNGGIRSTGRINADENITVQNGKGIIRSNDATQLKKVSTDYFVSASFTAGQTRSFFVSFSETFSATPEAYIGNITSDAGGWAEVVMSIANVSSTGAELYIFNPRSIAVNPSFTVKIIGIGAQ